MAGDALIRLRKICLALPQATEKPFGKHVTFRVRDKNFAMYMDNHHGDGRIALWCKAARGAQEVLVQADPSQFFVPPYVGPKGWVGVRLDRRIDWRGVAQLITDSYRMIAPKRLADSV
jgi:predicted DNA-binding protein (MmcQ/YjbR family)